METYSELVSQAQALMARAEQVRKQERAGVVSEIKARMKEYGITPEDLGGAVSGRRPVGAKAKAAAKYRGPKGELWSGGPGRKPDWVKAALAQGKDVESFRI